MKIRITAMIVPHPELLKQGVPVEQQERDCAVEEVARVVTELFDHCSKCRIFEMGGAVTLLAQAHQTGARN